MRLATLLSMILALFAVYFPAATYLWWCFEDPRPPGQLVVQLLPPFQHLAGNAFTPSEMAGEDTKKLAKLADDSADASLPVLLYENGRVIGPAHASFRDVRDLGGGRYYFSKVLVFSASDNSNPSANWRHYYAVVP